MSLSEISYSIITRFVEWFKDKPDLLHDKEISKLMQDCVAYEYLKGIQEIKQEIGG